MKKTRVELGPPIAKPTPASSLPLSFEVLGTPAPKGSVRAFVNRATGRAIVSPGGSKSGQVKVKAWATAVRERALELIGERVSPPFVGTALEVVVVFRMTRPMGHFRTGKHAGELRDTAPPYPAGKPDIDKLARTTLDALTGAIFDDDSRIARLVTTKVWAAPGREGAKLRIATMADSMFAEAALPPEIRCKGCDCPRLPSQMCADGFCLVCAPSPAVTATNAGATHASTARVRTAIAGTAFELNLPGHVAKHRPVQLELVPNPPPEEDFG